MGILDNPDDEGAHVGQDKSVASGDGAQIRGRKSGTRRGNGQIFHVELARLELDLLTRFRAFEYNHLHIILFMVISHIHRLCSLPEQVPSCMNSG